MPSIDAPRERSSHSHRGQSNQTKHSTARQMSSQQAQVHTGQTGPRRDNQVRHLPGSNFPSTYADDTSAYPPGTIHRHHPSSAYTTRAPAQNSGSLHRYGNQGYEAYPDPSSNQNAAYTVHGYDRRDAYQDVPRGWASVNPEVHNVLTNPALQGLHSPGNRAQPEHPNGWPLGYTNLHQLNSQRPPADAMDRYLQESQRAGPYHGIGRVGQHSDYERQEYYEMDENYGEFDE